MISKDREAEIDNTLSYLEYHASFSNPQEVNRAKQFRLDQKEESKKEAEEFIESVKNNEYKNNPLIDAIKKLKEADSLNSKKQSLFDSINLNKLIKEDL